MTSKETWLVAHDMSPLGEAAVQEAARWLGATGGHLRLFHVHAPLNVRPEQAWGDETYELEKELRRKFELVKDGLQAQYPNLEVSSEVSIGEPIAGILAEATRQNADHIVVGTHGRTGVAHLVLGSVAEAVAKKATCTVTIVKKVKGA